MKSRCAAFFTLALCLILCGAASAQQASPRIGPFVVDVRGSFPDFPSDGQLAQSRGVNVTDLPGVGIGVDLGVHLYPFKWKAVTFGFGGELLLSRAHAAPAIGSGRAVTERFRTIAPQVSFNFGKGTGWSYLSGGIGQSNWSIVPNGAAERLADQENLKTLNYGGGARWFMSRHLAFTFDVRFYAISPGTPQFGFPGSPHTSLLVMGAGVSVR